MTGIQTGIRAGRGYGKHTHQMLRLNQTAVSVWGSFARSRRLAVVLSAILSTALLLLGAWTAFQGARYHQTDQVRRLEAPGADFLRELHRPSHLEVVRLSPLRLAGTVNCDDEMRVKLQRQLENLYQIDPGQGEEVLLVSGPVPFHWVDHPELAGFFSILGMALMALPLLVTVQHAACRRKAIARRLGRLVDALVVGSPGITLGGVLLGWAPAGYLLGHLGLVAVWIYWRRKNTPPDWTVKFGVLEATVVLLSFPPEFMAGLLKAMPQSEVDKVTHQISHFPALSPEARSAILDTFYWHYDRGRRRNVLPRPAKTVKVLLKHYFGTAPRARRPFLGGLKLALVATSVGLGLGLYSSLPPAPPDPEQTFRRNLKRYLGADPLVVAVLERDGVTSAVVGLGRGSAATSEVWKLVQLTAEEAGLGSAQVTCFDLDLPSLDWLVSLAMALAVTLGAAAWLLVFGLCRSKLKRRAAPTPVVAAPKQTSAEKLREQRQALACQSTDPVRLEIGRNLLPLVEARLLNRVSAVRNHLADELGVVVPGIRFFDNLMLKANDYRILVRGREVARGSVIVNHFLAIGPEEKLRSLRGDRALDPSYGLPGVWISPEQRGDAERLGCMMFDPSSVVATQLTEVLRTHAAGLLTYVECCSMLDHHPILVEALERKGVDRVVIWRVFQGLVRERVSIAHREEILESLLIHCHETRDPELLREFARAALGPNIYQALCSDEAGQLIACRLCPELEECLRQPLEPEAAALLLVELQKLVIEMQNTNRRAIFVVAPDCRPRLAQLVATMPDTVVLSMAEVPPWAEIAWLSDVRLVG